MSAKRKAGFIASKEPVLVKLFAVLNAIFTIVTALVYVMPTYFGVIGSVDSLLSVYFFVAAILTTYVAIGVFTSSQQVKG